MTHEDFIRAVNREAAADTDDWCKPHKWFSIFPFVDFVAERDRLRQWFGFKSYPIAFRRGGAVGHGGYYERQRRIRFGFRHPAPRRRPAAGPTHADFVRAVNKDAMRSNRMYWPLAVESSGWEGWKDSRRSAYVRMGYYARRRWTKKQKQLDYQTRNR